MRRHGVGTSIQLALRTMQIRRAFGGKRQSVRHKVNHIPTLITKETACYLIC